MMKAAVAILVLCILQVITGEEVQEARETRLAADGGEGVVPPAVSAPPSDGTFNPNEPDEPDEPDVYEDFDSGSTTSGFNRSRRRSKHKRPGQATETYSCDWVRPLPPQLRMMNSRRSIPLFYQKYTEAYGIPVLGSSKVSDDALKRACYTARFLFADRAAIRQAYYENFGRFAVIAMNEDTTDIPEYSSVIPWINYRARGLGGNPAIGAEENAICVRHDRWFWMDVFVHEFAHGLHIRGANDGIPGFKEEIKNLYKRAKQAGMWKKKYAMKSEFEYLAEGIGYYLNSQCLSKCVTASPRERLLRKDPDLYNFIVELFPCNNTFLDRCASGFRRAEENKQVLRMNCDGKGGNATDSSSGNTAKKDRGNSPTTGSTSTSSNACTDDNWQCPKWANKGYCANTTKNLKYMNNKCKASCKLCEAPPPSTLVTCKTHDDKLVNVGATWTNDGIEYSCGLDGKARKNVKSSKGNCLFPFTYNGKTYEACTEVDLPGKPWCYTDDAQKVYGYC